MMHREFIRKLFLPEHLAAYLFIILGFIGISHHEMWLDELHHWQLARDSNTICELFHNARYDVHPFLWDILLFILTRSTHNPVGMQVLNLVISSTAAILILKYAPFSRIIRILFVFGYFLFYEYTIISRNYALGVLLIVCCCLLYRRRTNHYFLFSVALGVLANTHLLALYLSGAFVLALVIDYFCYQTPTQRQKRIALFSTLFYAGCVLLALIQIIPPSDSIAFTLLAHDFSEGRITHALSILTQSFFPIPQLDNINWWNTNFLLANTSASNNLIPILILVMPFFILVRKPVAMIIFYVTSLSTILFIFFFWVAGIKYFGFVFISFIASLWIAEYYPSRPVVKMNKTFESISHIIGVVFIYAVLIIQVIAGGIAWAFDFEKPFSQGYNTANYLLDHHLANEPIAVNSCDTGVPLSGYLDQEVFNAQINEWGSFCEWNLLHRVSNDTILDRIKKFSLQQNHDVTMVLNYPLSNTPYPKENDLINEDSLLQIHFLKEFTGSTEKSENYFIYKISLKKKEIHQ